MSDPIAFANLCSQFATANGTGTFALGARTDTKYFTIPEKIEVGSLVGYVARQGNLSEEGYGLLQSETQLTRIAAFDSSATGIANNINPGSPVLVSFDPTASIQVYCAVPSRLFISLDAEGNPTDPSPFRNALFVQSITEMKAEQGLSDGEAFFCANNGLFYFDASDATAPDNIDTFRPDNYPGGLFKRMRLDIQSDILGVSNIDASGTVIGADVVGAELKLYSNPKATNPNDWHSIFADVTASALRIRSRLNQSGGVKNFISVFSLGTTADRVQVHEPITMPTRTDATGLVTRAMVWLSGTSRLAVMMAGGGTREVALVKGFPVLFKIDIYALKQEDVGLISLQDGDVAVTRGSNTVSGNSTEANAGNVDPTHWYWASTSSATEDLVNVVRPAVGAAATGNGRWLREASDITANGTFTSGVSTPSVKNGWWFITAGATTITDFIDEYEGQHIVIQRGASNITITHDSTKVDLGGSNITLTATNPRIVLVSQGGVWRLVASLAQDKASLSGADFTSTVSAPTLVANGPSGTFRTLQYRTAGLPRFIDGIDNAGESGSDVGSNRYVDAVNDGNTVASNILHMNRATQIVDFTQSPTIPTPALGSNNGKAASTAYADSSAAYGASLTRAGIASARIATTILRFFTDTGAPWVRGTSSGPMAIADALGQYWQIDTNAIYGDPHWFGALGNGTTNDTAAFAAALAVFNRVVGRGLTYRIEGLTVPSGKSLEGVAKGQTIFRPTTAATAFCVKLATGASLKNLTVNGNVVTTVGVKNGDAATDSYQFIENVHVQFCTSGFQNWSTAFTWLNTSTDSCGKSIDSQAGWNNSICINHFSRGADTVGIYMTRPVGSNPNTEQPQAVRFVGCVLFGNVNAILLDTNVFGFDYSESVIDGCSGIGVTIAANSSNVHIHDNFLGATTTGIDIYAPGYDISIHDNIGPGNANTGIRARATSTEYIRNLKIRNNEFGTTSGGYPMELDSPQSDWQIKDNYFVDATPTTDMINFLLTNTTTTGVPTISGNRVPTGKFMTSATNKARIMGEAQPGNGSTMIRFTRATDTSPSGNFLRFLTVAGAVLLNSDVLGGLQIAKGLSAETGIFSVDASAGFSGLQVVNKSSANVTTKYITLELGGYDTTATYKPTAQITSTPQDANNSGSKLSLAARISDAIVVGLEIYTTVNALVPFNFMKRTLATLPTASAYSGAIIEVTDATGGAKICRSNGTVWQILNTVTTVV